MKSTFHPFQTDDGKLRPIHEKVLANQPLDLADVTSLYDSKDILAVGWLANFVRERRHGNRTLAVASEIVDSSKGTHFAVIGESDKVLRKVEELRAGHPQAHIAALTVEQLVTKIGWFKTLKASGADGLLGDGIELFASNARQAVWNTVSTFQQRSEAREAAMAAGLEVPLYLVQRHASAEQQATELLSFRERAADSFAAISYPADLSTSLDLATTTGMQELKHVAVARLALHNVEHIRGYWQMLGGKLAQIALRFGASEIDGTSLDADVNPHQRRSELLREIEVAGREPHQVPAKRVALVQA